MVELSPLMQFKKIAECNSLSAAARELHMSQPALSTMLRKLEEELGVKLFYRKGNRIVLNPAGEKALTHVEIISHQVAMMEEDIQRFKRDENNIRLSFCSKSVMGYLIPYFARQYPDTHLTTSCFAEGEGDLELLEEFKEDILITSRKIDNPDVVCLPFLRDQHYLSMKRKNPLAQKNLQEIKLDKDLPVSEISYLDQLDDTYCKLFVDFCKKEMPQTELIPYTDYHSYIRKIQDDNVITTTTYFVNKHREDGPDRIIIPVSNPELFIQYYVCYLKRNEDNVKIFLDWIREVLE